jgi:hypothetical protein
MKKLLTRAGALASLLILASLMGCFSGLESDSLGNALPRQITDPAAEVFLPPPSLANTDWGGIPSGGATADFVALSFKGDGTVTAFTATPPGGTTYSYIYNAPNGVIYIGTPPGTDSFTIDNNTILHLVDTSIFGVTVDMKLLPKLTHQELLDFVGEGKTPRYDYSSIAFVPDPPKLGYAQMTFEDGTFPDYGLSEYDDVAIGIIDTLGLFYLDYNSAGAISVVFPNFYGYHPTDPVIYDPSPQIITTLAGTVWQDANSNTVSFDSAGNAVFRDLPSQSFPYFYNGYRAGGVGLPTPTPTTDGGSFEIDKGANTLELLFYNFRDTGSPNTFELLQP